MYISHDKCYKLLCKCEFQQNCGFKGHFKYISLYFGSLRGRAKGFSQIKPLRCGIFTLYAFTHVHANDGIYHAYMHCQSNVILWVFPLFFTIFPNLEPLRWRGEGLIFNMEPLRGDQITQCVIILYAYDQKKHFDGNCQTFFVL